MGRSAPTQRQKDEWSAVVRWLVERTGSQVKLAAQLGVTRQTVASWCRGVATPQGSAREQLLTWFRRERGAVLATIPAEPNT